MADKILPYWQQRRDLKLGKKTPAEQNKADKVEREATSQFFKEQIAKAPTKCENCGAHLGGTKAINAAAVVAHILPKSKKTGCPSVSRNPLNKWYACGACHTDYDTKGAAFVKKMPIFRTLQERVAQFYKEIAPEELRRVPEYFRPKPHK
jgi:hypothetical protein